MKNLQLWDAVKTVPKQFIGKPTKVGGHTITPIDAYFLIREATRLWGSFGDTWGFKGSELDVKEAGDSLYAIFKTEFYYPDGQFPIYNTIRFSYKSQKGYMVFDDQFAKKVETNTISKALSRLGFGADIFMGVMEDAPVQNSVRPVYIYEEIVEMVGRAKDKNELMKLFRSLTTEDQADERYIELFKQKAARYDS